MRRCKEVYDHSFRGDGETKYGYDFKCRKCGLSMTIPKGD